MMRRLIDLLAPLGLMVIVGSQWLSREGRPLPGEPEYYLIAGAALILAHLVLRWQALFGRLGPRQVKYGANTVVLTLVVLGILGTINYLVVRNTKRWDLTEGQRFSLSDQTRKILGGLQSDAKITYFQREADVSIAAQDRLKEYQVSSPRIKLQYVDPWRQPGLAREYEITSVPALVIEYQGKRERLTLDSEQEITNALIKVTREGQKAVCFVEGEGERDPDDSDDGGYSAAKSALEKSQYATRKVFLLREKTVPSECTVLVLADPEKDLLAPAIDALREFVAAGGKLLALLEPDFEGGLPNLTGLVREWNVVLGRDVVVDVSGMGQLFGTGPITPLVADYPYHEITRDFRVMTAFHTARSVEPGTEAPEGVTAQSLLETSSASWAETDLELRDPIRMDEGVDREGPIPLGAAVTVRVEEEPASAPESEAPNPDQAGQDQPIGEKPQRQGRVVVMGDADFASNALLSFQGNQDLFLNIAAWLAQDTDLISIRPKQPEDQRMVLTQQQQSNVAYLSLIVLPGLFVMLGVATWWRRRG